MRLEKNCSKIIKTFPKNPLNSKNYSGSNLPAFWEIFTPVIYIKGTVSGTSSDLTAVEVEARLSNVKDRGGSRRKRKHSPDEVAQAGGAVAMSSPTDESTSSSPIDPLSDLYAVLEGSALIPFLESKLQANSFLEICSHATVYRYVVHIIRELGKI